MNDTPYRKWICDACGYIYDEAKGDPDGGLPPGTRYDDMPDDWECPLCGLRKSDLRPLPETPIAEPAGGPPSVGKDRRKGQQRRFGGPAHLVIVGAGIAGWSVAEAVRRRDPLRPILLVSACDGAVYAKPSLSTSLAKALTPADLVDASAETRGLELGVETLTRARVLKIDRVKRRLITACGGIGYGNLVLALGARQRLLPVAGDAADEVLRVNDLRTYRELRSRLDAGARHVTLLGAGLIGCEFADDLTAAGHRVTVVDPADRPLSALLPVGVANALRDRLADKGVDWRLGVTLAALGHAEDGLAAQLSDDERLRTDIVLSAAGLLPVTEPAARAGIAINRGIVADRDLCTSDPVVYAIGDCAEIEGTCFSYIEPIRRQAEAIAAHLVGEEEPFIPLPPLVRIKTPSMPMTVCVSDPRLGAQQNWEAISRDVKGIRLEQRGVGTKPNFVLTDDYARFGSEMYREHFG